jgi:hypothetical protein
MAAHRSINDRRRKHRRRSAAETYDTSSSTLDSCTFETGPVCTGTQASSFYAST